jgi:D-amino-acid dehydrogenase
MATLVIGGGLVGLSTAQALIDRGEEVLVIEANDVVGSETSFANGGMLTPSLPEPWNGPGVFAHLLTSLFVPGAPMKLRSSAIPSLLTWGAGFIRHSRRQSFYEATLDNYRLARFSLEKTRDVAERLGLNFDYADSGTLCVYSDERALAARLDLCGRLSSAGLGSRRVSVAELTEIEPALLPTRDRLAGGIWLPDDAIGDAHLFCRQLAEAILRQGGQIRLGASVGALRLDSDGVHSVSIGSEEFTTRRVVVAAGTGSRALLRSVGLGLPVQPAKGYSLTMAGDGLGILPAVAIADDATHTVFTVLGGRLRVAGTAEFAGYDKSLPRSRIKTLFAALETVLPEIAARVRRDEPAEWAGLRPMSNDGRPFVGPTRIPGLFLNTGHGALGWTMAMGSGHLVADHVLGNEPGVDGRPFLPSRH